MKILPSTRCSLRISSDFPRKVMIPIDQGGGGNTCHRSRFPLRKMTLFATNLAFFLLLGFLLFSPIAFAGNPRGTLVHDETIRVAPANDAAKLGQAERGHELVILDSSRDWTHVEAILVEPKKDADTEEEAEGKIITGWVPSRALVEMSNPNGDKIIFGEAAGWGAAMPRRTQCVSTIASMTCSQIRRWQLRDCIAPPTFAGR